MKYKGNNKMYYGIGIVDSCARFGYYEMFLYCFKLKQRNPEGEMLKRGRDYTGFRFSMEIRLPTFSWEK